MKRISLFLALIVAAVALLSTSCGTSDYMKSLTLSSAGSSSGGFYNLAGVDGTLQLQVTANYHSGKTIDVTNNVTWTIVPTGTIFTSADPNYLAMGPLPAPGPTTVTISPTGLMTGIAGICTWEDLPGGTNNQPQTPPAWAYTGYYQVTATYRNFTSQPVGIGMGIAESNSPTGGCGPS
ncbi:MAG: hypothetical protein WAN03_12175 [Candidatus Sulfotelmatobacter sp.]